jgi:dienelactone hydrolase
MGECAATSACTLRPLRDSGPLEPLTVLVRRACAHGRGDRRLPARGRRVTGRCAIAVAAVALFALPASAALVESQFALTVKVSDAYGKPTERPVVVTTFFDDATPVPRPLLVLNHGRAGNTAARAALGRARYAEHAAWFARLGFLVAVPTRIGYGVTGGEDVEDNGRCDAKHYPPSLAAAADQVQAVLAHLRARPDVASDRGLVAGQSVGGAAAIAVAARGLPGVQAAINFAGGSGGDPQGRPRRPCQANRLERLFADYGRSTHVPTLWIYAANDLYFGEKHPRRWFDAFREAGGTGEFQLFPPHGDDGHTLFNEQPQAWRPLVLDFLRRHGVLPPEPAVQAASAASAPTVAASAAETPK